MTRSVSDTLAFMSFADSLQHRLLVAIVAASAVGCGKTTTTSDRSSTAAPPSPSTTPVKPSDTLNRCGEHEKLEEMCQPTFNKTPAAMGTGEPAPGPSASAYDSHGCLPMDKVTTGCCNPAISGPTFKDGKCCYDVCTGSCCGRPFLVAGEARVADVTPRADWLAHESAADINLALRDAWLRDAQMEHASAAAFGRFMLQLLALGAPPALVRDAAKAAADEVRHAELCFALATRFGGTPVGPAPLSLAGALGEVTLADVVENVIAEGCVGETIAALTAARQLEGATDPEVRRALEQIQADEAAHAELAWRFVAWALDRDPEIRAVASAAFDRALGERRIVCADGDSLRAFGRLGAAEQRAAEASALADVIAPSARRMLTTSA